MLVRTEKRWYRQILRERSHLTIYKQHWGKGKYFLHGPPLPKFRRMRKGRGSMEEMNGRIIYFFSMLLEEKQIVPGPEDRVENVITFWI